MMRPFRFAVASGGTSTAQAWTELARAAEGLGYELLLLSDHIHQELAPLPALAAAASVTKTLRVGTYVLDHDFRHPVVLARELQTLDELSGGRLQVGLGAGWLRSDYEQTGIPFAPGDARVARLEETFAILDALLRHGQVEFAGDHFSVRVEQTATPARQRPRPPFMIGGGRRRILSFAARNAEIVSLTPRATRRGEIDADDVTGESVTRKLEWVREAAGARFQDLELNHVVWECFVTPQPREILEVLARGMGVLPERVAEVPCLMIGTAQQVAEQLLARRVTWGLSLITIPQAALRSFAPVLEILKGS